jgi:hypothetical protein
MDPHLKITTSHSAYTHPVHSAFAFGRMKHEEPPTIPMGFRFVELLNALSPIDRDAILSAAPLPIAPMQDLAPEFIRAILAAEEFDGSTSSGGHDGDQLPEWVGESNRTWRYNQFLTTHKVMEDQYGLETYAIVLGMMNELRKSANPGCCGETLGRIDAQPALPGGGGVGDHANGSALGVVENATTSHHAKANAERRLYAMFCELVGGQLLEEYFE